MAGLQALDKLIKQSGGLPESPFAETCRLLPAPCGLQNASSWGAYVWVAISRKASCSNSHFGEQNDSQALCDASFSTISLSWASGTSDISLPNSLASTTG